MPRSYFRTLPDLYERKAFGTSTHPPYPPAAVACFVGVLCFGEQQNPRGRFKSRRMLEALIEGPGGHGRAMARHVAFLIAQGDLVILEDGSLYIEGWDELQEGNWQVAERMQRYRDRRDTVTPTVTVPTVTQSQWNGGAVTDDPSRVGGVRAEGRKGVRAEDAAASPRTPRQVVHRWLSDHGAAAPVGWVNTTLNELVKVYGAEPIISLWDHAPADVRTSKQFVQHAERSLSPGVHKPSANGGHTRTAEEVERAFNR